MTDPTRIKGTQRSWQRQTAAPAPGTSRRVKIFILSAILLILTGSVLGWLWHLRRLTPPRFVSLCLSEYGGEFPVRRWVRQDAELLYRLPWQARQTFTQQQRDSLRGELRKWESLPSREPLVVYLSGYVRPHPQNENELYLLPADARPFGPEVSNGWIPLHEVFTALRDCPARHKVLLLDVMQPLVDPRLGYLTNDIAERIRPELERAIANDRRLSILTACAPGQVSLTAEELGHSVFAYYLHLGLRGAADGRGPQGNKDDSVTVQELVAYTTDEVERWATHFRQSRQSPQWFGPKQNFPLVEMPVPGGGGRESGLGTEYPHWLGESWKLRDSWWADSSYRVAPLTYLKLEEALLRAEQQWRGGAEDASIQRDLAARIEALRPERQRLLPPGMLGQRPPPRSLAQALAFLGTPVSNPEDDLAELRELAAQAPKIRIEKPDPKDVEAFAARTKKLKSGYAGKSLALAKLVLDASEDLPSPAGLRYLLDLTIDPKTKRTPDWIELHLLNRLADLPTNPAGNWPTLAARLALQATRETERITAIGDTDPQALPWVQGLQRVADVELRSALTLLFGEGKQSSPSERKQAQAALEGVLARHRRIHEHLRSIVSAQRLRDQSLVLFPGYVPSFEVNRGLRNREEDWLLGVAKIVELHAALTPSTTRNVIPERDATAEETALAARVRQLENLTRELQKVRRTLRAEDVPALIQRSSQGDPTDEKAARAFLESPRWWAEQRADLWKSWISLTQALRNRTARPDYQTAQARWEEGPALATERRLALRRALWSVRVLELRRLAGERVAERAGERKENKESEELKELNNLLRQAEQAPDDHEPVRRLANKLKDVWEQQRLQENRGRD